MHITRFTFGFVKKTLLLFFFFHGCYNGPASCDVNSYSVQLGDDEDSHRLVKGSAHTQALFVRTPVQAGDGLCGQSDVLQEIECPSHSSGHSFSILLTPLLWILTATRQSHQFCISLTIF